MIGVSHKTILQGLSTRWFVMGASTNPTLHHLMQEIGCGALIMQELRISLFAANLYPQKWFGIKFNKNY